MKDWERYQEEAAAHFRQLGLEATTNATLQGVRTRHDIDVLVRSHHVGFDITWLVECKQWKVPVSKLHVLALREIVADVGADRGILLSEAGFQSGAREAATLTNVQVTSLDELRVSATETICAMRLRELFDRVNLCKDRYWAIPKEDRISFGLRPEVGTLAYSGAAAIDLCTDLLTPALRGVFPFKVDAFGVFIRFGVDHEFASALEIIEIVDAEVAGLEARLDAFDAR